MTAQSRPVMNAAELDAHKSGQHGRDNSVSDNGYSDMEAAEKHGWKAISSWGQDGWNLGDWPYVAICTRERDSKFEMQQIVEGDHDLYEFSSEADRNAAVDYLFLWYAADKSWAPLTWEQRAQLDAGEMAVDSKFRGPYGMDRESGADDRTPGSPPDQPPSPAIEIEAEADI